MDNGRSKVPNLECLFRHREKGLLLSVYVDDKKFGGKKNNLNPVLDTLKAATSCNSCGEASNEKHQ